MATKATKSSKAKPSLEVVSAAPAEAAAPPTLAVAIDNSLDLGDLDAVDTKADTVKMKELLTAVVTKTGAKKKDAKDVVDAFLAEIGAALSAGKSLSLPPLGNLRVAKTMEKGGATMMVLRLRMGGAGADKSAKDSLAEDGEDS